MQKFILRRIMQYTERTEIEAENWDDAVRQLKDENTEFERIEDDTLVDDHIEYTGDK